MRLARRTATAIGRRPITGPAAPRPQAARLRDNAVGRIRQLIQSLDLKAGDRLPGERPLAERFGVSRGTIREALQFLATLGVVEIRHGGGCFLRARPSDTGPLRSGWRKWVKRNRGRVLEILEVRLGCEAFAAQLAARRAGPEELAQLVEALRAMKAAIVARDAPAFVQSDLAFHDTLLHAAGNTALRDLVGALGRELIPERAAILELDQRMERSFPEHAAIYKAVQAGDADGAALAMQRHLSSVQHDVLTHLLGEGRPVLRARARGGRAPAAPLSKRTRKRS